MSPAPAQAGLIVNLPAGSGLLPDNILFFVRALREAGLPVGPGAALRAIEAVAVVGLDSRADLRAALRAVLVTRYDQTPVFDQAFELFWRRRGFLDKLIAMMAPTAQPQATKAPKPAPGATRVADALMKTRDGEPPPPPSLDLDARLTMSEAEVLRGKDFAQMTAAEIARAEAAIARLVLPQDRRATRRLAPDPRGRLIDARASFRRSLRAGGAGMEILRRAPAPKPPPVVAICDISGSMSDYTRLFLHFLHLLSAERRVHSFLFGTRLTNITRALRAKDIDEALAQCSSSVADWSGGTRIGRSLGTFNRLWGRRVLGQGATVLLFTDGLERQEVDELAIEMRRLKRFARRVVWVNPLLRFEGFEAKAQGVRAMLPFVDEFRPIHNLAAMADLCTALAAPAGRAADPRDWLQRIA
jgi:uncharacterized protein with von Willebrand factor type A (vWA) domain